jgi:hypothetical protein
LLVQQDQGTSTCYPSSFSHTVKDPYDISACFAIHAKAYLFRRVSAYPRHQLSVFIRVYIFICVYISLNNCFNIISVIHTSVPYIGLTSLSSNNERLHCCSTLCFSHTIYNIRKRFEIRLGRFNTMCEYRIRLPADLSLWLKEFWLNVFEVIS